MSVICSSVDQGDTRFWKPIDDPRGNEDNPAHKVVAIPIAMVEENVLDFEMPKGVTIAVNRVGGGEFARQDIEAAKAYNCLVARVIELAA